MSQQPDVPAEALSDAVIDGFEFARREETLAGKVPIARFERLADLLAGYTGDLRAEVMGEHDGEGHPCLRLRMAGKVELRCQRCLEAMAWPVAIDRVLRLVAPGQDWPGVDGVEVDSAAPDAIEAEGELALLPLLEDEILLSLPIAPRHERCESLLGGKKDLAPSPFAVLARLKKH